MNNRLNSSKEELERQCRILYESLHRRVGAIDLHSMERLVRKIHILEIKIQSFKGGILYGKD